MNKAIAPTKQRTEEENMKKNQPEILEIKHTVIDIFKIIR